jgi:hypothetical protein
MKPTARIQRAMADEAVQRLARFDRAEVWQGLVPGDAVRIAGHRGRTWLFQAYVTNTSNGASWVEVSEVVVARGEVGGDAARRSEAGEAGRRTFSRPRSFRPELVTPLRKRKRRRRSILGPAAPPAPMPAEDSYPDEGSDPLRGVQASLFD